MAACRPRTWEAALPRSPWSAGRELVAQLALFPRTPTAFGLCSWKRTLEKKMGQLNLSWTEMEKNWRLKISRNRQTRRGGIFPLGRNVLCAGVWYSNICNIGSWQTIVHVWFKAIVWLQLGESPFVVGWGTRAITKGPNILTVSGPRNLYFHHCTLLIIIRCLW